MGWRVPAASCGDSRALGAAQGMDGAVCSAGQALPLKSRQVKHCQTPSDLFPPSLTHLEHSDLSGASYSAGRFSLLLFAGMRATFLNSSLPKLS